MRLFAIGDIHGCATALDTLLVAIALQPGDRVVTLGDYINKGPDTQKVLDRLIQLFNGGILLPLLGNHELKLLAAGRSGQAQIGDEVLVDRFTLDSYAQGGQPGCLASIPSPHWQFVRHHCLYWYTTADHIFVHGRLIADKPLLEQPHTALFWDKLGNPQPHRSGKVMICGHTPQRSGYPLNLGHAICLDTAACEGQWLTCLEVNSGEVWQANQRGQLRRSHLQDFATSSRGLTPPKVLATR
jgi:serine/threonine protein phosphatase 1